MRADTALPAAFRRVWPARPSPVLPRLWRGADVLAREENAGGRWSSPKGKPPQRVLRRAQIEPAPAACAHDGAGRSFYSAAAAGGAKEGAKDGAAIGDDVHERASWS
jgi:hypothetical protein